MEPNKSITLTLTEGNQVDTKFEGALDFPTVLSIFLTSLLGLMNSTLKQVTADGPDTSAEHVNDVKGEIFDMVNIGASQILETFYPEEAASKADRLTSEAILKAENEILTEYSDLPNVIPFPRHPDATEASIPEGV